MRPHRLSLTAFGSFPGAETVDFDALAQAGLFLVHGPTGAGKTTILDALCFALYGQVPGQRNSARALRCDHAAPSVGPSVTLEVTVRGRHLRIQRSPAWQRPKLRGTGCTEEKAKVIVEERAGAGWQGLTTRADEAGDLIGGLLGMNADQFCQVAMLPQGDFARFLRADGDDRRKLLERLFTVKVFTQTESWLAEHRKQSWREAQDLRQQVDFAIQRLEEAAGDTLGQPAPLTASQSPSAGAADAGQELLFSDPLPGSSSPGSADGADPGSAEAGVPSVEDDPLGWAGALRDAARAVVTRRTEQHARAEQASRQARLTFEQAAALADRRRRHAEALTLRRTLDERADERADLQAILDDAARAAAVIPLITAARQRAEAAAKATSLAADAVARARPLLGRATDGPSADFPPRPGDGSAVSPERLAEMERQRQAEIARLSELLTEEARLLVVRRDLRRAEEELAGLATEDEATAIRLAALPELMAEAEHRAERARLDAARIPAAEAVRAAAAELIAADRGLAALDAELDGLAQREAEVAAAEAELPQRLADVSGRLAGVRAEIAAIPAAAATLDAARTIRDAVLRRDTLAGELEAAAATHQALVDRAQGLREQWLDIRQARIDGMAAELARDLSDGRPCAVCGSEHHPAPASPAPSAPSADDELAAEHAHEGAHAEREAAERTLAALESRHADAVAATGGLDADAAEAEVLRAEQELARLEGIAALEPALAAELDRVEADREHVTDRARRLAEDLAAHRAHRSHLQAERSRLAAQLARGSLGLALDTSTEGSAQLDPSGLGGVGGQGDSSGLGGDVQAVEVLAAAEREVRRLKASAAEEPELAAEAARLGQERVSLEERARRVTARLAACRTRQEELSGDAGRLTARLDSARGDDPTLTARLSRLSDEAELLREALEATRLAMSAEQERARAAEAAERATLEAGFAEVDDVVDAARTPAELESKAERLRRLDDQYAAVSGILADPELLAAAEAPAPDLAAIEAEREAAQQAHTALASALDQAMARAHRLDELHGELAAGLATWQPAADRHKLAERMAALASGTSSDNQWSMSLSSYVLGERLRQVVDAANERLDHMSAGRYLLRHDLRKTAGARGRSGGGLGLRISDGWTGVERDPATLSGGESFITSLALALGLADVVTAEAGGAEIGTLFVDEGFGTLDEDTLDGVLDILDELRDGGRAVGVISHVAELRSRIPAQLKVSKTRAGSSLSVV
ncbi:AAA family ATPase [Nonomuraea cavernae]|uniref:Nuclease SbcCD subunit C n=1 Tax=Nonomuraea cavernae TaxID=2045107 RepID=A0A917ZFW5_9ACTN|nr:SMC family ATPase [Nonomuraea cavernae]GGO82371.1 hypothetical protein GCM10012289_73450 [Nonomuraea cavernae]